MPPKRARALIELRFAFKDTDLYGRPHEYEPRLVVWSTDRDRMPGANPGMAAQFVEMSPDTKRDGWLNGMGHIALSGASPIATDPMAEICIVVQAKTLSDGHEVKPDLAARPYHIRVGQVNVQWYGLLAHLYKHDLSRVTLTTPVETLCGFESVVAEHHFEHESKNKARVYLKHAEEEATRGTLEISCRYRGTPEALATHVRTAAYACPGGLDPSEYAAATDAEFRSGIKDYMGIYDEMFPDSIGKPFVRLPEGSGAAASLVFEPDTKNMRRFHLPLWSAGGTHLPFVEWWLTGINQPHDSDSTTEQYFGVHSTVGLSRAGISSADVIDTVETAFSPETDPDTRTKYASAGTPEREKLLKAIEATYYTVTALQVSCSYATDGRYINKVGRVQVEAPQRDGPAGFDYVMDCEDDEITGAIQGHLLEKGLGKHGAETEWNSPLLRAMVKIMRHYATLHNFGSVRGAKLADATADPDKGSGMSMSGATIMQSDARHVTGARGGTRLHYQTRLLTEHRSLAIAISRFFAAHPELSEIWRKTLPKSDSSAFWGRAYGWLESYIETRDRLVLARYANMAGYVSVVVEDDDTLTLTNGSGEIFTASQEAFWDEYYRNLEPWQLPAADVSDLSQFGYGGDVYSGDYSKYPLFFHMGPLLQMALLFWTWLKELQVAVPPMSLWNQKATFSRARKLIRETITQDGVANIIANFRESVAKHPNPRDEDDQDTFRVMHMQPLQQTSPSIMSRGAFGSQSATCEQHHTPHWHMTSSAATATVDDVAFAKTAKIVLSESTRVVLGTISSIDSLRRWLDPREPKSAPICKDARENPHIFWLTMLCLTHPEWIRRRDVTLMAMRAHGHDKQLTHHVDARQLQFGSTRFWRNVAMWVEWFEHNVANTSLVVDWAKGTSTTQRHKALHRFLEHSNVITITRRKPAKHILKAMLSMWLLHAHVELGKNCHFANLLYKYAVKALGALAFAPVPLKDEEGAALESRPVDGAKTYGVITPATPLEFTDQRKASKKHIENCESRVIDEMPDAEGICTALSSVLPLSGKAALKPWLRVLALLQIFHVIRLEYLVTRIALRGEQDVRLVVGPNERVEIREVAQDTPVAMSVRDFLTRFYQAPRVFNVALSPAERLAFFVRIKRRNPPALARLMMALEVLLTARVHESTKIAMSAITDAVSAPVGKADNLQLVTVPTSEVRTIKASGVHLLRSPEWPLIGAGIGGDTDAMAIAEFAQLSEDSMELYLRTNSLIAAIETNEPLLFWLGVLEQRFPAFHRQLAKVFVNGDTSTSAIDASLANFGLPNRGDRRWRYAYLWLAFYINERWTIAIDNADDNTAFEFEGDNPFNFGFASQVPQIMVTPLRVKYSYLKLNRVLETKSGKILTLEEALQNAGLDVLADWLSDGFGMIDNDAYGSPDVSLRLRIMDAIVVRMFRPVSTTENALPPFETRDGRADLQSFTRSIIRTPMAPPRGDGKGPAELPFIRTAEPEPRHGDDGDADREPIDSDGMLIDNRADAEMQIGGHMFLTFMPLAHLDTMYAQQPELMKSAYPDGNGPHVALETHVNGLVNAIAGSATASKDAKRAARCLVDSMVACVGEGTGRQQLMMRALDAYHPDDSDAFLQRSAAHISEAFAVQYWNEKIADGDERLNADIYSFQAHLFQDTMKRKDAQSGKEFDMRLSPFYRRIGHSCSEKLHSIHPDFAHLVWVRPQRRTFGANLRHILEGTDALPMPAHASLRKSYTDTIMGTDALKLRGKRLAPVCLRFPGGFAGAAINSGMSLDRAAMLANVGVDRVYANEQSSYGQRMAGSLATSAQETSHRAITFDVPSGSKLAKSIRKAARRAGQSDETSYTLPISSAIYINEPPTGPIDASHFENAAAYFGNLQVDREALLPTTPAVYRIGFSTHVCFHIA